jgi:hypothetical protein
MGWYLLEGSTIEDARKHGMLWLRDLPNGGKEMFRLPEGYFKNLEALPPPELAYTLFCIMKEEIT